MGKKAKGLDGEGDRGGLGPRECYRVSLNALVQKQAPHGARAIGDGEAL